MSNGFVIIEISGEILKKMEESPLKSTAVLNKLLRKSVLLVQNEAKKNAPFETGSLRRSITHEVKNLTGTVGTDLVYARIQEEGGDITPKTKKYLRFKTKGGNWVTTKKVRIKKQPYLKPALTKNRNKIIQIFNEFATLIGLK